MKSGTSRGKRQSPRGPRVARRGSLSKVTKWQEQRACGLLLPRPGRGWTGRILVGAPAPPSPEQRARGAVPGPELRVLPPAPWSLLPALAEKMAQDFTHLSCPPAVQTQACVPSASPTSFPNVPALGLTLTRPHSVRALPLSSLKGEHRGTVWVGSHVLGGRKRKLQPLSLQGP